MQFYSGSEESLKHCGWSSHFRIICAFDSILKKVWCFTRSDDDDDDVNDDLMEEEEEAKNSKRVEGLVSTCKPRKVLSSSC